MRISVMWEMCVTVMPNLLWEDRFAAHHRHMLPAMARPIREEWLADSVSCIALRCAQRATGHHHTNA
jgi:hypothetical protein